MFTNEVLLALDDLSEGREVDAELERRFTHFEKRAYEVYTEGPEGIDEAEGPDEGTASDPSSNLGGSTTNDDEETEA